MSGTALATCESCGAANYGNFDCPECRSHLPGGDPFCGDCDSGWVWDPRVQGNVVPCPTCGGTT